MKETMIGAVIFLSVGFGVVEGAINWVLTALGA